MKHKILIMLCSVVLLTVCNMSPTHASDGGPFGVWGTKMCPRNYYAVLHALTRGKVHLIIENHQGKYVNNEQISQDNISGTIGLGSWDWSAAPWWTYETSPDDYVIANVWATCSPEAKS